MGGRDEGQILMYGEGVDGRRSHSSDFVTSYRSHVSGVPDVVAERVN